MANFCIPKKRGLSPLQQNIVELAKRQGGEVLARDVLIEYYGFRPLYDPANIRPGAILFDKVTIGHSRYNAATVSVCKAFNRLVQRGIAQRIMSGIQLKGLIR